MTFLSFSGSGSGKVDPPNGDTNDRLFFKRKAVSPFLGSLEHKTMRQLAMLLTMELPHDNSPRTAVSTRTGTSPFESSTVMIHERDDESVSEAKRKF